MLSLNGCKVFATVRIRDRHRYLDDSQEASEPENTCQARIDFATRLRIM